MRTKYYVRGIEESWVLGIRHDDGAREIHIFGPQKFESWVNWIHAKAPKGTRLRSMNTDERRLRTRGHWMIVPASDQKWAALVKALEESGFVNLEKTSRLGRLGY